MGIKGDDDKPLKLLQHVKTRWNSVYVMMERLVKLRWPVVAVLSDRSFVKLADAKTLDVCDEHWQLMEKLLPVLQPLQTVTSLLSAEVAPSSSTVYPMMMNLRNDLLTINTTDMPAIHDFKGDLQKALAEQFKLDDLAMATHLFGVASILDPATRALEHFDMNFKTAAYNNVRDVIASSSQQIAPPTTLVATETTVPMTSLAEKKIKLSNRSAMLAFLGGSGSAATPEVSSLTGAC